MVGCFVHSIGDIATHGHTRGDKPEWRIPADFAGEPNRGIAYLLLRHQHIGKPHRVGFLANYAAAGVEHQRSFGLTDHCGQRDRKPEAGVKTKAREISAEARFRTGHAKVSHHRKPKPTTNGRPMYRSDNWFFGTKQSVALNVKWRDTRTWLVGTAALRVECCTVTKVGTGAKSLALSRQDNCPNMDVVIEALESASNLFNQWYIEEIVRRSPDLDQTHVADLFDANIAHPCVPLLGCGTAFCPLRSALDDQGVDYGDTITLAMHDDGIEIDFSDVIRVIECELRKFDHEIC
jgi:hypothetical protein